MSQVSIIDIEGNHPQIPTQFDADIGFAIPIGNVLEILGDVVPAGVVPVYTTGSGNTITTNVQISQAIAASNVANVGLAAFDSSAFEVDANGFVSLIAIESSITINGDVGASLIGNVFSFLGQKSNSANVMDTNTTTGDLVIANNTWFTPYIVDSRVGVGVKGTYTTIQSAINAIVADGISTTTQYGYIRIRRGTYTENLIIPSNFRFFLQGEPPGLSSNFQPNVFVNGTFTITSSNVIIQNIGILGNTSLSQGAIFSYNSFINTFSGTGGGSAFLVMYGGALRDFTGTNYNSVELNNVNLANLSGFSLTNCQFSFKNCIYETASTTPISLDGTTTGSIYRCSDFYIIGNTTGIINVQETSLASTSDLPNATINYSGNFSFIGSPLNLYTTSNNNNLYSKLQGNIFLIKKISTNYVVLNTDYYLGITSTSSTISLTLPNTGTSAKPQTGQSFIFTDESLACSTNNIVITANGGTIQGNSSLTMNIDGQSITIIFDGTNYFVK